MGLLPDLRYGTKKQIRSLTKKAEDVASYAGSVEKFVNRAFKPTGVDEQGRFLQGDSTVGTQIRGQIERKAPLGTGKYVASAVDVGLAPGTIASALFPPLAVAGRAPIIGRGAVSPIARVGSEIAVGAAAGAGSVIGGDVAERAGAPRIVGEIAGGIGAGGVSARALRPQRPDVLNVRSSKQDAKKFTREFGEKPLQNLPEEGSMGIPDFFATRHQWDSDPALKATISRMGKLPDGRWWVETPFNAGDDKFVGTPEELSKRFGKPIVFRKPGEGAPPVGGGSPDQDFLDRFDDALASSKAAQVSQSPFGVINSVMKLVNSLGMIESAFIQGLTTLASDPKLALNSVRLGIASAFNPKYMDDYKVAANRRAVASGRPTPDYLIKNKIIKWSEEPGFGLEEGTSALVDKIASTQPFKGSGKIYANHGNVMRLSAYDTFYQMSQDGIPFIGGPLGSITKNLGIVRKFDMPDAAELQQLDNAHRVLEQAKNSTKFASENADLIDDANSALARLKVKEDNMRGLGRSLDRLTGYAEKGFGGRASSFFYAARFLQAQMETVLAAVSKGDIEGHIARNHLLSLMSYAGTITVFANEVRGKDTEFRPWNNNFMRIRDIEGQDISLFGWTDSLLRQSIQTGIGGAGLAAGAAAGEGFDDEDIRKLFVLPRSKASPLASIFMDLFAGENAIGHPNTMEGFVRSRFPFAMQPILKGESIAGTIATATGLKSTPLSSSEEITKMLTQAGIRKDDPDYLIKRKDFLASRKDELPHSETTRAIEAQTIRDENSKRTTANEAATLSSQQSLVEYRENRKIIGIKQREALSQALGDPEIKGSSKQHEWIRSYLDMFDKAEDEITGEVNNDKFTALHAKWLASHGEPAQDFIDRWTAAGRTPVAGQYVKDMQQLDKLGYFDMPRYRKISKLSDDDIDDYRQLVQSFRSAQPELEALPFDRTVLYLLGDKLSDEELYDVANSGRQIFLTREYIEFRGEHNKLLQWFNPSATWASYSSAQPKPPDYPKPKRATSSLVPKSPTASSFRPSSLVG